jgi:hypothetical protein
VCLISYSTTVEGIRRVLRICHPDRRWQCIATQLEASAATARQDQGKPSGSPTQLSMEDDEPASLPYIILVLSSSLTASIIRGYHHVRLTEKSCLKVLFVDLLWEKNIIHWLKKYGLPDKRAGPISRLDTNMEEWENETEERHAVTAICPQSPPSCLLFLERNIDIPFKHSIT